jgi:hypothetical protein
LSSALSRAWIENLALEVSPLLLVGGRVIVQAT